MKAALIGAGLILLSQLWWLTAAADSGTGPATVQERLLDAQLRQAYAMEEQARALRRLATAVERAQRCR